MTFYFLTLFPDIVRAYFSESVLGHALEKGCFGLKVINIRDFSTDRHHRTDDYPYGGGAGMVMTPQPVADAVKSISDWQNCRIIYPSPSGERFCQQDAEALSHDGRDIIFICGHYEGLDQRIIDRYVTDEYSLGDYVLTGGELPALAMADAVLRHLPGVLGNCESLEEESFGAGLLEYPQYTRPPEFEGMTVPEVLRSGHHANIKDWQRAQALARTKARRPDLYKKYTEAQLELEN